jgi:predicted nucleic acid-binding protein
VSAIFVDTSYRIARINPRDQWHHVAVALISSLKDADLITSDAVLTELLNYFSGYGPEMREAVALIVRQSTGDTTITVDKPSYRFDEGLAPFESRPDKRYSMTDCMSMSLVRRHGITEVLTHDHHFAQEGFRVLL